MILNTLSRHLPCATAHLFKCPVFRLSSLFSKSFSSSFVLHDDDGKEKPKNFFEYTKSQIKVAPVPALVYGVSGLIPFVALPALMIYAGTYDPHLHFGQLAYGAVVLSSIGGIRLGVTLSSDSTVKPDWYNLTYSSILPLLAWSSLLVKTVTGSTMLMFGFILAAYIDVLAKGYPKWFKLLRLWLSSIVVLSMSASIICRLKLPDTDFREIMQYSITEVLDKGSDIF